MQDPKKRICSNLLEEYGKPIQEHLLYLSEINGIHEDYLKNHKVTGAYRAKMVDWMVEVLTAFKCSDQTFFLAVSLMDRYFNVLGAGPNIRTLEL